MSLTHCFVLPLISFGFFPTFTRYFSLHLTPAIASFSPCVPGLRTKPVVPQMLTVLLAGNVEAQAMLLQTQETRRSTMKIAATRDPRRRAVKQNDKNELDGVIRSSSQTMTTLSLM
jgi:hypothetical protein